MLFEFFSIMTVKLPILATDFMFYWNVYNYDSQKEEKIEISIEKY